LKQDAKQSSEVIDEPATGGENRDDVAAVLDILKGGSGGDDSTGGENRADDQKPKGDSQTGEGENSPKAVKTLADAAEALQMPIEQLFGLEFNVDGDGASFTLSQAKDAMAEQHSFDLKSMKFEEEQAAKRGEFLKAENMLRDILSLIPRDQMPQKLIDQIRQRQEAAQKTARNSTLSTISEWSDPEAEKADRAMMSEHLERAGYHAGYLDGVMDPVSLAYIRQNAFREKRIEEAISKWSVKKPGSVSASKPAGQHRVAKIAAAKTPSDEIRQVSELLKTGEI
jgi:hypothetical protein